MNCVKKCYISPVIAATFVAVSVTGVLMMLHIRFPGIKSMHEWLGVGFLLAGLLHLILNWKAFLSYFHGPAAFVGLALVFLAAVVAVLAGAGEQHRGPYGGPQGPASAQGQPVLPGQEAQAPGRS